MFSLCVGVTLYQSKLSYNYRYTQHNPRHQYLLKCSNVWNKNSQFLFNNKPNLGKKKLRKALKSQGWWLTLKRLLTSTLTHASTFRVFIRGFLKGASTHKTFSVTS